MTFVVDRLLKKYRTVLHRIEYIRSAELGTRPQTVLDRIYSFCLDVHIHMTEETRMRAYELAYILVPTVSEGDVAASIEVLKTAITTVKGTVHSEGAPEFIDLAYRIEKHVGAKNVKWDQGYFGWLKFEAAPDVLEALKKVLDGNIEIARYLLIKTDLENTIVFKKPKVEAVRGGFDQDVSADEDAEEIADEVVEDMKEDHEKLPDVAADIETTPVSESKEA